jgi:hypothetical protein
MRLVKQFGLNVIRAGLFVAGGAIVLSGLSTAALAVPPGAAPEIDPGSMSSAVTLLVGGIMLFTGRRIRK